MSDINRLSFLAFCLFLLASCQKEPTIGVTYRFCPNEVSLLASSDSLPHLNATIRTLYDRDPSHLDSIFDLQGAIMRYTVDHVLENGQSLKLRTYTIDYKRLTELLPPMNPHVNQMHFYLTRSDSIIVKNETSSLTAIQQQIKEHYSQKPEERYPVVFLAMFWDMGTDVALLSQMMTEIIHGFIAVANDKSMEWSGKPVCELNEKELVELANKLPFRLKIDLGKNVGGDFMTEHQRNAWRPIRFR